MTGVLASSALTTSTPLAPGMLALAMLPVALGVPLTIRAWLGSHRLEALLKVVALVWGLIIGAVYYGILFLIAIPGIILILYEGLTDSELNAPRSLLNWITGLSYWESDNYAYAFGDRDEPAWLPDTDQER